MTAWFIFFAFVAMGIIAWVDKPYLSFIAFMVSMLFALVVLLPELSLQLRSIK